MCRDRAKTVLPLLAVSLALVSLLLAPTCLLAQEPPLPAGLGDSKAIAEPSLPAGLSSDGPSLPSGLDSSPPLPGGLDSEKVPSSAPARDSLRDLPLSGFFDIRGGVRTRDDSFEKADSLGETRLQLETEGSIDSARFKLTADFLYDWTLNDHSIDLEAGRGWIDLRQAWVSFTPADFADVKLGRQIFTWGTGDLLFVNDLFPKDWQAFFIGRDLEYLKSPSDALKLSLFSDAVNLDLIYTPKFDPDRFITGERLSYYNAMTASIAGRNAVTRTSRPNDWLDDDEWAFRLYRNISGYEFALYGYDGYWKSPAGMSPATGKALFPRLSVYGASARGRLSRGIGSAEIGYYDSRDDSSGANPFVNNSQLRLLAGYEQDLQKISRDFTIGLQYYLEWMQDYSSYRRALPPGSPAADEYRHVCTLRLTKLLMNQNLTLSLFAYYAPGDSDAYLRPHASYKINDYWNVDLGANVFVGKYPHTFFGQFEDNSNIYAGLRCSF